jgi:GrpB-like predicted nucleotidyltransferase (UPF0157 family)
MTSGEASVEIVAYDPSWPERFADEKGVLGRALATWLAGPIEHVGSTAVQGLAAKPVIDIMAGVRTHHLHLVPVRSPQWIRTIAFRDYLRAHPAVAAEYGGLKRRLAQQYQFDREAYTEAKHPFIARVADLAVEEGYGDERKDVRSPATD